MVAALGAVGVGRHLTTAVIEQVPFSRDVTCSHAGILGPRGRSGVSSGRGQKPVFSIRSSGAGLAPRTLHLSGELDMAVSGHLRDAVERTLAATSTQWLIVDLQDTTLIDSGAVKEFVDVHRFAARQGRVLILRNANGIVAEVLRVTGVAATLGRPANRPTGTIYGSPTGR